MQYWDLDYPDKVRGLVRPSSSWLMDSKRTLETRTEEEMIQGVRERLVEAVRLRLRADVPVGVYLSGGLDSSAVAGITADLINERGVQLGSDASRKLKCFCVQFPKESGVDESGSCRASSSKNLTPKTSHNARQIGWEWS
jgi:asparagine synthase (glutamine-hydrolysing)